MPRPGPRATAWRTLQKRGTQPGGAQGAVGKQWGTGRLKWRGVAVPLGVPSSLPQALSHCCWRAGPLLSCSKALASPGTEARSVSLEGMGYRRWGSILVPGQIISNSEIPSIKGPRICGHTLTSPAPALALVLYTLLPRKRKCLPQGHTVYRARTDLNWTQSQVATPLFSPCFLPPVRCPGRAFLASP